MSRKLMICLVFAALVSTAWGWSGTFVNANTVNTSSDANDPWWKTTGNDSIPLWRERTPFGLAEGGSIPAEGDDDVTSVLGEIYQARDSWGDAAGLDWCTLQTTATGLDSGETYYVYAFYWTDQSNWQIRAAFTEAALTDAASVYSRSTNSYQVAVEGTTQRVMFAADMGTVTGVTELTIWIDDLPSDNTNERVWYDGIGYGVDPIPEPMTIALLGLGGLFLRRRKH